MENPGTWDLDKPAVSSALCSPGCPPSALTSLVSLPPYWPELFSLFYPDFKPQAIGSFLTIESIMQICGHVLVIGKHKIFFNTSYTLC